MRKLKNKELERKTVEEFKASSKLPFVIVLDNIRSLNNVGSFFRTADAFLVDEIHLCGISATPPNKEIHKTALGSTDSVNWKYFAYTTDSIKYLKENKYRIYAIEQADNSVALNDFVVTPYDKYALIFGNEVKGVQQSIINLCNGCVEIPQYGTKHSINVSVSGGVVMWEFFKQYAYYYLT